MQKNKTTKVMAILLMIFFITVFLVVTGRFLYIQAAGEVQGVDLGAWADDVRTTSYKLPSERGKIFDSNGMTLAYDMPTFRIYAVVTDVYTEDEDEPKHVVDPIKTANLLSPILEIEESYILERLQTGLSNEKTHQVEFGPAGRGITLQKKDEIEALNLPGIQFIEESSRYYPNGMFASHIIGFAREEKVEKEDGATVSEITGISGIEHEMNEILHGEDGYISYKRDIFNKKLLDANELVKEPEDGDDIYLTIDQKIQTLLEDVLSEVDENYEPERITAIVMNPKTGEIIAMGNRPSYNPNNPGNVENWYNDAISTPFEPGSTIKMFTWAAAIEEGVYDGSEGFQSGSYRISNRIRPINDHNNGQGWGVISYDEGFARSSNVAASKLVWEKIGTDRFLDYLSAFDFDKVTGIDLPGETSGTILYNWPAEKLTTAFGQGSTTTPIQQMKAATAIANGGKMMKPYVIDKVIDPNSDKVVMENKPEVAGEPISEETAAQVRQLLKKAVEEEYGSGRRFQLEDYSVAGKTGTAQIPDPNGGYMIGRENYYFSFLGMAPADDPQLLMYVSVKQPDLETEDGLEYGSAPVSFIFKNVMENSLHYLNIEPDNEEPISFEMIEMPEIVGENPYRIQESLQEKGLKVSIIGNGNSVSKSNVKKGDQLLPTERVILVTESLTMPDLTGWSLRDAFKLGDLLDMTIYSSGSGYVTSQSIKAGSSLKKENRLEITLQTPYEDEEELEDIDEGEVEEDNEAVESSE